MPDVGIGLAPFRPDRKLTAIAIGYGDQNGKLIADKVSPRTPIPGGGQLYTYRKFRIAESFQVPNTLINRTSDAREVEHGFDEFESKTKDYGLQEPIPRKDIRNAPSNYDPVGVTGEWVMGMVKLDRERRVANMTFDPANYPADNVITLSGLSQFSHPDSQPIQILTRALDRVFMRPNKMVIGEEAFTSLSTNPQIVRSYQGAGGISAGIVPVDYIAKMFRLDEILIGSAWLDAMPMARSIVNPANMSLSRIWGKHIALLRVEPVTLPFTYTFGCTPVSGSPIGMRYDDPTIGLEGGVRIKMGEILEEIITAPEFGYLIRNVAA